MHRRGNLMTWVMAVVLLVTVGVAAPAAADSTPPPNSPDTRALGVEAVAADCPTNPPGDTFPRGMDLRQLCLDSVRHAPTFEAARALLYGFSKLGTPYSQDWVLRTTSLFDCSSFVGRAYTAADAVVRQNGVNSNFFPKFGYTGAYMPANYEGSNLVRVGSRAELRPGDIIILFDGPNPANSAGNAGHAQLYLGNNYVLHSGSNPYGASMVNVRAAAVPSGFSNEWYFRYNSLSAPKSSDLGYLPAGTTTRVQAGNPNDTVVGNLTVVDPQDNGFTTAYPCDQARPTTSVNNYNPHEVTPNLTVVRADAQGYICIFNQAQTHLIWDQVWNGSAISGHAATRVMDTRLPGGVTKGARVAANQVVKVATGAPSQTVIANLTVTDPTAGGHTTVWPCNVAPSTSSVNNFAPGETTPNFVMSGTDEQGNVCVKSTAATHLIWDQVVETTAIATHAAVRRLDTRYYGGTIGPEVYDGPSVPANRPIRLPVGVGQTVFANLTVVSPVDSGFTTVYPCAEGRPNASVNNFVANQTTPNGVMVRGDAEGYICIESSQRTHLIWDQVAETGSPAASKPSRIMDSRLVGVWRGRPA